MRVLVALLALLSATPAFADERLDGALTRADAAYAALKDYRAIFTKQEREDGQLGPKETIFLKFEKPFKIFMRWQDTHKEGLQVLYERGKHDNRLAIHKPGLLLGLAPVVFLDQNSPWVREGSESYDIEDAGIGSFLEDFEKMVRLGEKEGTLRVLWEDEATVETLFEGSQEDAGYFARRVVVHFDPKTGLPDRMRLYDWNDEPMGDYAYGDLRIDIGRDDPEFQKLALKKLHRLYFPEARTFSKNDFSGKRRPAKSTAA
jgi:hypothetical protein